MKGCGPSGGVGHHETCQNWLTNLVDIFRNLINKESAINEACQTCQQKLFRIHG